MGYPTRVQLIKCRHSHQWYVNFPAALAEAMEFEEGELVEGVIESKKKLSLRRTLKRKITSSTTARSSLDTETPRKRGKGVDTHGQSPWHFTSLRDEKTQAALDLNPGGLATEHMTISLSHQALLSIRNTLVTI